ncbi:hypothetical protein QBC38DRAFT_483445 [Podospora fimiseda]|uniref:F-box domain-containing protein n=1 Tax=Podospora fimiseda TaxID=252190 RepID=A0AAN7BL30_9PEZI|nr:hypothetical protein QBC38DRAFT_483445 [Podospora fimiseda]
MSHIASHLDKLPLELIEPIISQITFRDAIALTNQVQKGSHLWNAFSISPVWKRIWPMIIANREQFETLTELMINVNGRIMDLTGNFLDGPPGKFLNQAFKEQGKLIDGNARLRHSMFGWAFGGYNVLDYAAIKASQNLTKVLSQVNPNVLSFICQELPIDLVATLAPSIDEFESEVELRKGLLESLQADCMCDSYLPTQNQAVSGSRFDAKDWMRKCRLRHPTRPLFHFSIPQTKAFVAAYSEAQKKLNSAKADELRDMSKLYHRHHSMLKMPLAPQTPRKNPNHIPEQLGATAKSVEKIIDIRRHPTLKRSHKRGATTEGGSRFMYPHACLIPYDWCLRLWRAVVESMDVSHAPKHILQHIDVVKKGMDVYYGKIKHDEFGGALEYDDDGYLEGLWRTKIRPVDKTPAFAVHQEEALDVLRHKLIRPLLPSKPKEVEWLVAFLEVVKWVEGEYPEVSDEIKGANGDLEQDPDVERWVRGKTRKGKNDSQVAVIEQGLARVHV